MHVCRNNGSNTDEMFSFILDKGVHVRHIFRKTDKAFQEYLDRAPTLQLSYSTELESFVHYGRRESNMRRNGRLQQRRLYSMQRGSHVPVPLLFHAPLIDDETVANKTVHKMRS